MDIYLIPFDRKMCRGNASESAVSEKRRRFYSRYVFAYSSGYFKNRVFLYLVHVYSFDSRSIIGFNKTRKEDKARATIALATTHHRHSQHVLYSRYRYFSPGRHPIRAAGYFGGMQGSPTFDVAVFHR